MTHLTHRISPPFHDAHRDRAAPAAAQVRAFAFYTCFRLADPEQAELIMNADPYYWTQDNGAGGPIHFSTTYKQLDMVHHILNNCPEAVNQSDQRGFTPLHR